MVRKLFRRNRYHGGLIGVDFRYGNGDEMKELGLLLLEGLRELRILKISENA
jgi:hypothetical protein